MHIEVGGVTKTCSTRTHIHMYMYSHMHAHTLTHSPQDTTVCHSPLQVLILLCLYPREIDRHLVPVVPTTSSAQW